MLSHKSRLLYNVGQRFGGILHKQLKATAASDVNPFYYQDILETEKKPDIPWKKLTGTCTVGDHPRRRGRGGFPKLSLFSLFQAQGEVVLHTCSIYIL